MIINNILKSSILILLCILVYGCFGSDPDSDFLSPVGTEVTITSLNTELKIEAKAWGISGNHQRIRLTADRTCDTLDFHTNELYYKAKGADSLILYTSSSSYSDNLISFCNDIFIVIHKLKNYDDIKRMEKQYKKMQLKRVSVYND